MPTIDHVLEQNYRNAKDVYARFGVDTDEVLTKLSTIAISLHCWQGDDVSGFEGSGDLTGGIQVTGSYPGRARNPQELRQDIEQALSLIPGKLRLNLHALYAETEGERVERNQLQPKHFENWVQWAKTHKLGLDFNPSFFSHPLSNDGFTLSHPDPAIRSFWIEHGQACRRIGGYFGKELGVPCVTNIWIPDGYKDIPIDRVAPRQRLLEALDTILAEPISKAHNLDAVESKLFGIGSESYVVGSHEFYLGYATRNNTLLCLDSGHFHPTEVISNKISAALLFLDQILLHVSRPVRWDSDHVVVFDDELQAIMEEIVRGDFLERTHLGLDFFDASINRIAAWVIGTRNAQKALLKALLEPTSMLRELELAGDLTARLALSEELKAYPWSAVWDYYCATQNVPIREAWLQEVRNYEQRELSNR